MSSDKYNVIESPDGSVQIGVNYDLPPPPPPPLNDPPEDTNQEADVVKISYPRWFRWCLIAVLIINTANAVMFYRYMDLIHWVISIVSVCAVHNDRPFSVVPVCMHMMYMIVFAPLLFMVGIWEDAAYYSIVFNILVLGTLSAKKAREPVMPLV